MEMKYTRKKKLLLYSNSKLRIFIFHLSSMMWTSCRSGVGVELLSFRYRKWNTYSKNENEVIFDIWKKRRKKRLERFHFKSLYAALSLCQTVSWDGVWCQTTSTQHRDWLARAHAEKKPHKKNFLDNERVQMDGKSHFWKKMKLHNKITFYDTSHTL